MDEGRRRSAKRPSKGVNSARAIGSRIREKMGGGNDVGRGIERRPSGKQRRERDILAGSPSKRLI
jgi:hypothetical protein